MKRIVVLLFAAVLLAGCGQEGDGASDARSPGSGPGEASSAASEAVTIATSDGESIEVRVEVADDEEEMARGLMGRTALAEEAGMLFVYPEEGELSFWMKDTLIPLSIAYMDSGGRIVDIQDMEALDDTPPHYVSAEPAKYALEVNQGFFDERGVEVGDTARLPV